MTQDKDPLDPLLDRWTQVPPSPNLKSEVWRRIAVEEAEGEEASLWEKLEAVFRRPSFSFTFVLACALAGLFVAELRVTQLHQQRSTQFAHTYLKLIDPLLNDGKSGATVTNAEFKP